MSLRDLVQISPLGCVGMFLLGGCLLCTIWHVGRLWRRGRAQRRADFAVCGDLLYLCHFAAIPAWLAFGPHGPAVADFADRS